MRKFLSSYPKWLVFALAGLLGAGVFNGVYEFFVGEGGSGRNLLSVACSIGVRFGFFGAGITLALFVVQRLLLGAESFLVESLKPIAAGFILSFVSGAAAQYFYYYAQNSGIDAGEIPRIFAWALAGGGLGVAISLSIPNLKMLRSFSYGTIGGAAGALGFIFVCSFANDVGGRLVGTGIIGLFVGLSVAIAEATAKEGYLRVVWGPGEYTRVNLGEKPVLVGSSRESTVRMASSAGYPPIVATFSLQKGQATMVNHMSRTTHVLRNGNKLTLGTVVIEIHLFS
jgi:Ca-activated chloride channel family protein